MFATGKSLPQRRLIADRLHKLIDDERSSDDIFALTMNLFDRFIRHTDDASKMFQDDRSCQLMALSCYTIAKKLRATASINNENEQIVLIYHQEGYHDDEIFVSLTNRKAKEKIDRVSPLESGTDDCRNVGLGSVYAGSS